MESDAHHDASAQCRRTRLSAVSPARAKLALSIAVELASLMVALPSNAVDFDRQALLNRGLDPALADMFREAPRFTPGSHRVIAIVNGNRRGEVTASFDEQGALVADAALLQALRLRLPEHMAERDLDASFKLESAWPNAIVRPDPGQQHLYLILPPAAVDYSVPFVDVFQHGGAAAMLNYDVSATTHSVRGRTGTSWSASTEAGFNAADWVLRSRQAFSRNAGTTSVRLLDAYAQRSLITHRRQLQLGDVYIANPLFAGASLLGFQVLPEEALDAPEHGRGVRVEGIANSEARVEIRQHGALVHSTLIPPGPFLITGFTPRDARADLEVIVFEEAGERRFTVPASSYRRATLARPGSQFAAGRLRDAGRTANRNVAAASGAWRLPDSDSVISAGAMTSDRYQAVAMGFDHAVGAATGIIISSRSTLSAAAAGHGTAHELRVGLQHGRVSTDVGATRRNRGYQELNEWRAAPSRGRDGAPIKWQVSAAAGWSSPRLGGFSASWSPQRDFNGRSGSRWIANWSRKFGSSTLATTFEFNEGRLRSGIGGIGGGRSGAGGRAAYLSWSLPLDGASIRATGRQRNQRDSVGISVNGRSSPQVGWRASLEQDMGISPARRVALGADLQTHHALLSGSATHSEGTTTLNGRLSGGVVIHEGGISLAADRVQDTFGIVRIGQQANIRISTDGADAWSNPRGYAVLPRLRPYAATRIEVDGRSLPRRADIENGTENLRMARGAVARVQFNLRQNRRLLIQVKDTQGAPLRKGLTVLTDGMFSTSLVADGRMYLADFQPTQHLEVVVAEGQRCTLELALHSDTPTDAFYEEGSAVCVTP